MRRILVCGIFVAAACGGGGGGGASGDPTEALSGGTTTVVDTTRDAFSRPLAGLASERRDVFFLGNSVFNTSWVSAPASADGFDGLGPLFNTAACSNCHFKDGRGKPPTPDDDRLVGLLFRLSVPGVGEHGGTVDEPTYGGQLQPNGILGVPPEGSVAIDYTEEVVALAGGETASLRRPIYRLTDLAYGPMRADVMVSPRVAPAMIGLGLLEAIPEADLRALEDPEDRDGDGVSGRANQVWDVRRGAPVMGRFGWKAGQPTVEQQTAGAFNGDMGISSSLFPRQPCTDAEAACLAAPTGEANGERELTDTKLGWTTLYGRALAVPARRNVDAPEVRRGRALFDEVGCAACHRPTWVTGDVEDIPELSRQTIHPYTDLLLHDLGDGLADGRSEFAADGREWRTPPLWGIGLVETVNRHRFFLHDGRARGLLEAVLWHGGEAQASRDRVIALSPAERAALIAFLESL
jgi:CxxC motif-containing protein (DUF1111 family)